LALKRATENGALDKIHNAPLAQCQLCCMIFWFQHNRINGYSRLVET
jgi:hypothetical protein